MAAKLFGFATSLFPFILPFQFVSVILFE